jgi:hypothetical protein
MKALPTAMLVLVLYCITTQNAAAQSAAAPYLTPEQLTDKFFDDHLTDIGCEKSAWEEMRNTMKRKVTNRALPPTTTPEDDFPIVVKTAACFAVSTNEYYKTLTQLEAAFRTKLPAGSEVDAVRNTLFRGYGDNVAAWEIALVGDFQKLTFKLSDIQETTSQLISHLNDAYTAQLYAQTTMQEHMDHAHDVMYGDLKSRYASLAARYNNLVDEMAEVRRNVHPVQGYTMPQQPQTLHCDIETMKYDTSITTVDCR